MDAKGKEDFGTDTEAGRVAVAEDSAPTFLSGVFAAISDGACWLSPEGGIRPLNRPWYELHGSDPDASFADNVAAYEQRFTPSRPDPDARHPLRRALQGEDFHDLHFTIDCADGTPRALRWSSVQAPGTAGRCIMVREPRPGEFANGKELLQGLTSINAALAAKHDLQKLVQMVTDAGTELSGAEFGAFFYNVSDEQGEAYMLYTLAGPRADEFAHLPKPRPTDIFSVTFRAIGILRVDDVTKDRRYGRNAPFFGLPKGHAPVRSYLAAPVVARDGEVLGGLFFGHSECNQFDQAAESTIGALAAQAAIAIESSRAAEALEQSEERVRRRLAELSSVYDTAPVGLALVAPDLRLARINARMVDLVGNSMQVGDSIRDLFPQFGDVVERYYSQVISCGEPVFDVELMPGDRPAHVREVWLASFYPVWTSDRILMGVNTVVQDISAHKRAEARLQLQHAVTATLAGAKSLDQAAPGILRPVIEELRVSFASLWLLEPENGQMRCVHGAWAPGAGDLTSFHEATRAAVFDCGQGLLGAVWEQESTVWIAQLETEDTFVRAAAARACGLRGGAGFPIFDGPKFIGIIEVYADSPLSREPRTEQLMESVGRQIGTFVAGRAAETALLRSEERLRFALEAANLGTWEWNQRTGEVHWSGNMEPVHGMEPGTFQNTFESFLADVHPDDREHVLATIRSTVQQRSSYRIEYRLNDQEKERWVEGKGQVLFDGNGEPYGMTGVCSDITERKHSEERFRLALEASPSAIVMVDSEGRIAVTNRRVSQLFGYDRQFLAGKPIEQLLQHAGNGPHPVLQALRSIDGQDEVEFEELTGLRSDGRALPVTVDVSPIGVGAQRFVLCAVTDISERKRAEENIRRINEQLWRKNEEMEQFVYSVSHDLKSPLVTVIGFVGMLKEDLAADNTEGAADSVDRIERATRRMSALINDLLQLSRIGRVEINRQTISIEEIVNDLAQDLRKRFETKRAKLHVVTPLPEISADRARVVEVLDNLLSNALKYGCSEADPTVTVGAVQHPEEVRIYVRDNGPGIPAEYQDKVFQAFQRLSNQEDGTGVGLAIVEKIMRTHGGRSWVESEPEAGATFWLAFPERPE